MQFLCELTRIQIRVGMSVGHSPNEAQWAPDMRKDEKDITEQDKWEAKRRIQGNYNLEDDSDESPPGSQIAGQGSG